MKYAVVSVGIEGDTDGAVMAIGPFKTEAEATDAVRDWVSRHSEDIDQESHSSEDGYYCSRITDNFGNQFDLCVVELHQSLDNALSYD